MKLPGFITKEILAMALDSVRSHKFRSVLTVLGTAVVVVIYGAAPDLDAFRRGWIFVGAAALASALAGCAIAARRNSGDSYRPGGAKAAVIKGGWSRSKID